MSWVEKRVVPMASTTADSRVVYLVVYSVEQKEIRWVVQKAARMAALTVLPMVASKAGSTAGSTADKMAEPMAEYWVD